MRNEDRNSHCDNLGLVAFNIPIFPISELLNPKSTSYKEKISSSIGVFNMVSTKLRES